MDEPRRSAARVSGYVIPIALGILLVAYLWQEEVAQGSLTLTYSRLLGSRIEGEALSLRLVAGSVVIHLPLFVVAFAVFRRATARSRTFVFGAAWLLGVAEILQAIGIGVFAEVVGESLVLSGVAGLLLIVGALGALARDATTEIRDAEGGRA